jgi:hypothetical protein
MYKRDGLVRDDLRRSGIRGSRIGLFHHQRAFAWERIKLWREYGTRAPSHVISIDGVPLISIYEHLPADRAD